MSPAHPPSSETTPGRWPSSRNTLPFSRLRPAFTPRGHLPAQPTPRQGQSSAHPPHAHLANPSPTTSTPALANSTPAAPSSTLVVNGNNPATWPQNSPWHDNLGALFTHGNAETIYSTSTVDTEAGTTTIDYWAVVPATQQWLHATRTVTVAARHRTPATPQLPHPRQRRCPRHQRPSRPRLSRSSTPLPHSSRLHRLDDHCAPPTAETSAAGEATTSATP